MPTKPAAETADAEVEVADPRAARELIEAAADGEELNHDGQKRATDWLLSEEPADSQVETKSMDLNVGTEEEPVWVTWVVRSITPDELRRVQLAQAREDRQSKQEPNELDYHAKVMALATVSPDVKQAAAAKGIKSQSAFLKMKFKAKAGLIPQVTARVMSLSGFDEAHVREVEAGKI